MAAPRSWVKYERRGATVKVAPAKVAVKFPLDREVLRASERERLDARLDRIHAATWMIENGMEPEDVHELTGLRLEGLRMIAKSFSRKLVLCLGLLALSPTCTGTAGANGDEPEPTWGRGPLPLPCARGEEYFYSASHRLGRNAEVCGSDEPCLRWWIDLRSCADGTLSNDYEADEETLLNLNAPDEAPAVPQRAQQESPVATEV